MVLTLSFQSAQEVIRTLRCNGLNLNEMDFVPLARPKPWTGKRWTSVVSGAKFRTPTPPSPVGERRLTKRSTEAGTEPLAGAGASVRTVSFKRLCGETTHLFFRLSSMAVVPCNIATLQY